jgi:hypothetical protein
MNAGRPVLIVLAAVVHMPLNIAMRDGLAPLPPGGLAALVLVA